MMYPDIKQCKKLRRKGNMIPVMREIIIDSETPVSLFAKLCVSSPSAIMLESVEFGERIGRYSLVAYNPECIIEKKNGNIEIVRGKKREKIAGADILQVMKGMMSHYRFVPVEGIPALAGGFFGFISYENVAIFERIELKKLPSLDVPEAVFFLCKELVVFDHVDKKVKLIVMAHIEASVESAYEKATKQLHALEKRIRACANMPMRQSQYKRVTRSIKSNMTRAQFEKGVRAIKEYICAGDIIQAVFSQRFDLGKINDDFAIYRALRTVNPSPYMFYMKHHDIRLIGSSPEVLVKKEGKKVTVRPIAGTRRRGKNEDEDNLLAAELRADVKERAEHVMLVDLGRNDIGRVCTFGTVHAGEYGRIEKYSHVMHLVSDVEGTLHKGKDCFDVIRATFPAGTVSGAPKIRAMQIINELEPTARGPYAGCVGYVSFSGDCNMCITIRTIMVDKGHAYVQAGAGIVYDSVPAHEYVETVNKAKALLKALDVAALV